MQIEDKRKLDPIYTNSSEWPVLQIQDDWAYFKKLLKSRMEQWITVYCTQNDTNLQELIEKAYYHESRRIAEESYKVDTPKESDFWETIKDKLLLLDTIEEQDKENHLSIVSDLILDHYVDFTAPRFKESTFKFARRLAKTLSGQLFPSKQDPLSEDLETAPHRVKIYGNHEQVRELGKHGTLVFAPTHISNLDPLVISWVIDALGLPPFHYAAGFHLYNVRILKYFMSRLGAFKTDRRRQHPLYELFLSTFTSLMLEKGAHTLVFPAGSRTRSGAIEEQLKNHVLRACIEAQRKQLEQNKDQKKIFVVPIVMSYNSVLESQTMITQFLSKIGKEQYYLDQDDENQSFYLIKLVSKLLTRNAELCVKFCPPLDVFGNNVDEHGTSITRQGTPIDIKAYFEGETNNNRHWQRETQYAKILSKKLTSSYKKYNYVLSSHLMGYIVFRVWRSQFIRLSLFEMLRLPIEKFSMTIPRLVELLNHFLTKIEEHPETPDWSNKIRDWDRVSEDFVQLAIQKLGRYNDTTPLYITDNGLIETKDILTLFYYHNRLNGYDFERYFTPHALAQLDAQSE